MPIVPLDWKRNDEVAGPGNQPTLTGKGVRIQLLGKGGVDQQTKGTIVEYDSKGGNEKRKTGCGPQTVIVVCGIALRHCGFDLTYGSITFPPGLYISGVQEEFIYECCPCTNG